MDIKYSLRIKHKKRPPLSNMSSKSFSLKSLLTYIEELDSKLQQQNELINSLTQQLDSKASVQELCQHELEVKTEIDQIKTDIKTIIGE